MMGSNMRYLQLFSLLAILLETATAINFRETSNRAAFRPQHRIQIKASDGYSSSTPCSQGTPRLPNYIQPTPIDPKRILGMWYRFSRWYPGIESANVTTANAVTTYTNLLNDSLTLYPGSNTPAVAFEQLGSRYSLTQNQCGSSSFGALDYATVDGQFRGIAYFSDGSSTIDTTLVLATDYDNYALFYQCLAYDVVGASCLDLDVYVDTRQPINLVSSSTVSAINDAVNRILTPYCVTADMLRKNAFLAGVDNCPVLPAPKDDCYTSLRNAYLYLGDPNFTG